MFAPKDYGSTELLVELDHEENKWKRFEQSLKTVKVILIVLVVLYVALFVMNTLSLYLISTPRNDTSVQESSHDYDKYLRGFPEKTLESRNALNRSQIYRERMEMIRQWNSKGSTVFEANQFTDWSVEEIKKILLPHNIKTILRILRPQARRHLPTCPTPTKHPKNPEKILQEVLGYRNLTDGIPTTLPTHEGIFKTWTGLKDHEPPENFDWRQKNVITPVKNQGNCGSCWAFATTGLVEAANAIASKKPPVNLSEQELVDCDMNNIGCLGGSTFLAMVYVYHKGLVRSSEYPYKAKTGDCKRQGLKAAAKIRTIYIIPNDEKMAMTYMFQVGPIAVAINATLDLLYYKSGVFHPSEEDCRNKSLAGHALLVVGYGTTKEGEKYWIVKNSWGERWGMDGGYVHFIRGVNACGIEEFGIGTDNTGLIP